MRFDAPDRWAELWIAANDRLVRYRDDRGNDLRVGHGAPAHAAMAELLRQSIALPRPNEPLPVFVHGEGESFPAEPLNALIARLFPLPPFGWMAVRSFRRSSRSREPFELPLNIVTVGREGREALLQFEAEDFVSAAKEGGTVVVDALGSQAPSITARLLNMPASDVLITTEHHVSEILSDLPRQRRPRLVVTVPAVGMSRAASEPFLLRVADAGDLLRDSAFIEIPATDNIRNAVHDILLAIVHDEPLHHWAHQHQGGAFLIADPRTNQSLRMTDAFAAEVRRDLETRIGAKPKRKRALKHREVQSAELSDDIFANSVRGEAYAAESSLGEPRKSPLDLRFQFDRESNGLIPLTRAIAPTLPSGMESAVPIAHDDIPERRRVDARIERVESVPNIDRWAPASDALWVGGNRTLRRGARYRLRVQIGQPAEGNLIPDSTPDLVLPPTPYEHWELDVVVFRKDFDLRGASQQRLILPKRGASQAVYFDITAPMNGDAAQLRFAIYLGNQILQSFRLDAVLAIEEIEQPGALRVELDLAKSSAFANLDSLGPRALSIGLNDDGTAGVHALLIKIGDANESLTLTEKEVEPSVKELRQVLETASVNGAVPVFPAYDDPLDDAQKQAFEVTIRQLARIGGKLRNALFNRASAGMRKRLRDVARSSAQTLQFPRYAVNFAVPWRIVYDFGMPSSDQNAPVCDGKIAGGACGHQPGADAFCINGFWGIRHAIEEHLASTVSDARKQITSTPGQPKVRAADGVADGYCDGMITALTGTLGNGTVTTVTSAENLFQDILWKNRPAIMMFLGHLDQDRRIQTPSTPPWLTADAITDYAANAPADWEQPYPIVLLMACEAMSMDASTLNDHALALTGAGAAAVVGPECRIFSPFACRVAQDLILALLKDGKTLGVALSDFRRQLVRAGNPLGFAFTAYGDADVAIV
jgi:hypothetical protein